MKQRIILGIDPGTAVTGYGIINVADKKVSLVTLGVLKLSKYDNHYTRLQKIFERVTSLIQNHGITEFSVEAPFYGENVQSMLKLGRAQGAAITAAATQNLRVFEYAPLKVKQSITGMGKASKEQVAFFLNQMFKIKVPEKYLDASDALAVAVCHHLQTQNPVLTDTPKNWKDFIKKNPDRVRS